MLVRVVFLGKASWCAEALCVRASRFSLGVAQGRVQHLGALGHHEHPGWWKHASHKTSTAPLPNCPCTAPRVVQMCPGWFYTCCPALL